MYLLEVQRDHGGVVQGFIYSEWPIMENEASSVAKRWATLFNRSARLWKQLGAVSAGIRIEQVPGRPLATVHSFVAPSSDIAGLRMLLGSFLRTDQMGSARTTTPFAESDLDEGGFVHLGGEHRMVLSSESMYTPDGLEIYQDQCLRAHLSQIFASAMTLGTSLAYEAQVTPWRIPSEALRRMLYNTSHLEDSPSIPSALVEDQKRLCQRLRQSAFHIEECLAAPTAGDAKIAERLASDVLNTSIYARNGIEAKILQVSEDESENFRHHVHSHIVHGLPLQISDVYSIGTAVRNEVDNLLACYELGVGKLDSHDLVSVPIRPERTSRDASAGELRPSVDDGRPFLFISYSREDKTKVVRVADGLLESSVSFWIDSGIIGGDDWMEELELRLVDCVGVLAFVSPKFAQSRYCRREIQFADALGKLIIPIVLEPAVMAAPLNFILRSLQDVDLSQDLRTSDLVAAIERNAPKAMKRTG